MGQAGFAKKMTIAICVLVIGGLWFGYDRAHASEVRADVQKRVAAQEVQEHIQRLTSELTTAWSKTLSTSPADGNVDIAVYDKSTGTTAEYTNATTGTTYNTASIVKMSILEKLLLENQQHGISGLTSAQMSEAVPMIENSDNDAATALWSEVGDDASMNAFFQQIGATDTTAGLQDTWGLTQTTALDQLKVVDQIAYPKLLSSASVAAADNLLNNVEADQKWGVSGGVPSSATVQLKNGWLDYNAGWNINSIGHVHGDGVDYTIAVLTDNNNTEQDGINTIQALSTATWNTLSAAKSS
jgi:beta-lactamase class A